MEDHYQDTLPVEVDNLEGTFYPSKCRKTYGYDSNKLLTSETLVDEHGVTRVKTYTYTEVDGVWLLNTESVWVRQ